MNGSELKHFVGADGKLYFNYPVGAVYLFSSETGTPFCYRITSCEYEGETEYYTVESAGVPLKAKFTAKQLNFMLGWIPYSVVEEGQRIELPLLNEEVVLYYSDKQKELNKENAEANAKLKDTRYKSLTMKLAALVRPTELARVNGENKKVAELEIQKAEYEAEQAEILKAIGIDENVLRKIPACKVCGDNGLINGKICECAYAQQDKIKAYNAIARLKNLASAK